MTRPSTPARAREACSSSRREIPDMDKQREYVLRKVEDQDVRFIRLWFTDVLGFLTSFAITPAELEEAFERGVDFDGSAIDAFARVQGPDMVAQPVAGDVQVVRGP